MHRRSFLAMVAASTGGCLHLSANNKQRTPTRVGITNTPTKTILGTLIAGDYQVGVTSVGLRPSIFAALHSSTPEGVIDEPNTQYVIVNIDNQDAGPIADLPLALVVDGQTVADDFRQLGHIPSNRLAFPVSTRDAQTAALKLSASSSTDQWALPAAQLSKFGQAAEFAVPDLSVPDTIQYGHRFEVSFTVRNTGDRDGRFLAELAPTTKPGVERIRRQVAAGTTETTSTILDPAWNRYSEEVSVVLDWGVDQRRAMVAVKGTSTPTPRQRTDDTPTDIQS